MTEEQIQTIDYYRKKKRLLKLTVEELETLKETLGEHYTCLFYGHNPAKTLSKKLWKSYQKEARRLTKLQDINSLPNADKPRASHKDHFWSDEHYVIDHKISIWYGFNNGMSVEEVSDLSNLRWITAKENCLKGIKCV